MPVHVEEMSADVTMSDAELPLSDAQMEKLVEIVLQRLKQSELDEKLANEAATIRGCAAP